MFASIMQIPVRDDDFIIANNMQHHPRVAR